MDSILNSVKKMIGIAPEYDVFDPDLIIHINSVFAILQQLGVGPEEGFYIEDANDEWDDFTEEINLQDVKSYMFLKVRMLFDPPSTSNAMQAMTSLISEFEWRLNVSAETP